MSKIKSRITKFKKSKPKRFYLVIAILIALIICGMFFLMSALGVFGAGPSTGPATVKVIDVGDDNEDVSDEADVTVWECDISEMTTDDLTDLTLDDYDKLIDEKHADEVKFTIQENYLYKMKVKYKGSEIWKTPEPGENVVMMVKETTSVALHLEAQDDLSRAYLGNIDLDYYLRLICADEKEGLMPSYMYGDKDNNLIWLCFNFTRASQENMVRVDDYYNTKIANGTAVYVGITGRVVDRATYEVTFGSGKAVTYDCNNIGWFFGFENNIVPVWMN